MQLMFLKIINRIFLICLILSLPFSVLAKTDMEFPYHLEKTVEKEKIYEYTFEDIWETALILIKETEEIRLRSFREAGLNSVKANIKTDKSSGLITFYLTHKGKKGIFSDKKSLFFYQALLLKTVNKYRTRVNSHEINFLSYDQYVFHIEQLARYVDFTPSEKNILEKIIDRLKERGLETH
jgi:hypothetical protein